MDWLKIPGGSFRPERVYQEKKKELEKTSEWIGDSNPRPLGLFHLPIDWAIGKDSEHGKYNMNQTEREQVIVS